MGLVDDAIGEFQRAARDPRGALRAREALGGCFLERGSPDLAVGVLERALDEATGADANANELSLLGVVYLLGEAYARLGQHKPARACFQRVVTADIEFRDAARRLMQLPALTP
jgi:tetratricopeptide (TPR) repeat protein